MQFTELEPLLCQIFDSTEGALYLSFKALNRAIRATTKLDSDSYVINGSSNIHSDEYAHQQPPYSAHRNA